MPPDPNQPPDPDMLSNMPAGYFAESVRSSADDANFQIRLAQGQMNTFEVEIQKKFSLAAACVVFVIIGVPFALRFSRGGVGIVIGASLVVFAVSYVGLIAGEGLAKAGRLSPIIAMWAANAVLAGIGVALLLRMGKESITRGSTLATLIDDLRSRSWLRRSARKA
jgi:lipopolysaccharide export system permease protein